jgi:hypothetical protein
LNTSQYKAKNSLSPGRNVTDRKKSPNLKKFAMEDNNDQMNFREINSLKSSSSNNAKSNIRYNDINANSKFYFPAETHSIYDSDISSEPAQWNDRSNRNALYENRNEPRGRKPASPYRQSNFLY